jgi:acetyl-CoA C-acetyltransferase
MRDSIYLIAAGQTPVVKQTDLTVAQLGAAAVKDCLSDDALPSPTAIYSGNMLSGILSEQQQLSAMIAYEAGLKGLEALTIEAACGSGGSAMHIAMMSVASGMHDCVIAMGVEKMGHAAREKTTRGLATASNWRTEGAKGETFVSLNGRLMQAYMDRYGVTAENFAPFSLVAHANACKNPYALFHKDVDLEKYMNSKLIDGPVRLYDASPICDGSAAVLVANEETAMKAKENGFPIVRVRASSVATDAVGLDDRNELLTPAGVIESSNRAYEQAGLGPDDIDIFELHDAYTIMSILSLEGAGFAKPGEGWRFGAEKKIEPTGDLPIAVAGGLKARGHPVGATGVYQLVENYLQLTDQAGDCQLEDKNIAMTQNVGGTAATIATHILERVS